MNTNSCPNSRGVRLAVNKEGELADFLVLPIADGTHRFKPGMSEVLHLHGSLGGSNAVKMELFTVATQEGQKCVYNCKCGLRITLSTTNNLTPEELYALFKDWNPIHQPKGIG